VTRHRVVFALSALVLLAASCDGNGTDAPALAEGDPAPTFTLPSASGGKVKLSDFAGEKPALLYFSMGPG
jgi:cytochrome oxidase Cu insertion factor (SCO1/SenC/PrrC family)